MTFPTPFTVRRSAFSGTGIDDLGNDIETWSAPVSVAVIGWYSSLVENTNGYTSRVVADIDLLINSDVSFTVRDRVLLPGDTTPYEVVAIDSYNNGFHQWTPGSVVKLKKVTG